MRVAVLNVQLSELSVTCFHQFFGGHYSEQSHVVFTCGYSIGRSFVFQTHLNSTIDALGVIASHIDVSILQDVQKA